MSYRAYRFRAYPTAQQAAKAVEWQGPLRYLWNLANEQRLIGLTRTDRRFVTAVEQQRELTDIRRDTPWLAALPRGAEAQLLVELDRAWQNRFRGGVGSPHWKRRGDWIPIIENHPRHWRLEGDGVFFPKMGTIRLRVHREVIGDGKTCTLTRDACGDWFVIIVSKINAAPPSIRTEPVVAIDRGVVNAVADSDGRIVASPRFYAMAIKQLARAQRDVSRKKKGSKNRQKAKARVAVIHRKVARQRAHFTHQLSHDYAKSHGTVVVEKLQIRNMARVGGRLSRGILDAGWGMLVGQLRYKTAEAGGHVVEVDAAYSSQECHDCGHVDEKSRRSQSEFVCTGCGLVVHADTNAALVLKSRASRSAQPVEGSAPEATRRSRKPMRTVRRAKEEVVSG